MNDSRFTVVVSTAESLADLLELGNDLLEYESLGWDDALRLIELSVSRGFRCIMIREVGGANGQWEE